MSSALDLWSLLATGFALLGLPALWRFASALWSRRLPPADAAGDSLTAPPPAA